MAPDAALVTVSVVELFGIDPKRHLSGAWIVLNGLESNNSLQDFTKVFPIGMNVGAVRHGRLSKQESTKLQNFVARESPFVEKGQHAMLQAHFPTPMQRQGIIEPRIVMGNLLCLGKEIIYDLNG